MALNLEYEYEDELELEWTPRWTSEIQLEAGLSPKPAPGSASAPSLGDQMSVRMTVVGHASPRWKSAKTPTEADRRNQGLSELRARNVRAAVANILKKELPKVKIDVDAKGVGSPRRFPGPLADNLAVDRSVEVRLDLTTKTRTYTTKPNPPRRIFAPSKFWEVTVVDAISAVGGLAAVFLRIVLKNYITGKQIVLSGKLLGGGMSSKVFDLGGMPNPGAMGKQIGDKVVFETPEALTFDDFDGVVARMGKVAVKFGFGSDMTYVVFPLLHHRPGMLIFDYHRFKLGFPKAEGFVVAGKLRLEGMNPGDWFEVPGIPDIVPTQSTHYNTDGIVLSFPTGRAGLGDLTAKDRKRLVDFVTNKARNIGVLLKSNYAYVK